MYDECITVTFYPQPASVLNRLNSGHAVVTQQMKTVSASVNKKQFLLLLTLWCMRRFHIHHNLLILMICCKVSVLAKLSYIYSGTQALLDAWH